MKARIASIVVGLLLSLSMGANHILGGNITYECLGGDQYLFSLTIYKDCFGATPAPGIENVFFIPEAGCSNIAFSAPFDLISETEISDLCPSELVNSSCSGGFNPGAQAVLYQQTITLDPNCVWEVSYGSGDWNYFVNMDNSLLPTAYISTSVDTNFGCNNSVTVSSDPVPYACVGDPVSYFLTIDNPDGYTVDVTLTGAEIADGVDAPYNAGYTAAEPIPGMVFDPVTGEVSFTAPATFGNYVVAFEITLTDGAGNVIAVMNHSMAFTIRICDSLPTYFTTPPMSDISGGTSVSDTEVDVCVGDTLCFTVEAVNDNPFRQVTISSPNLATLFADLTEATSTPGNPGSMDVCVVPQASEAGSIVIDFDAIDDACVNPDTDALAITVNVLPQLAMNVLDSLMCFGDAITLEASGDSDYTWNVISGTSTPAISGTSGTQNITPDSDMQIEVIANNAPTTCNYRDTLDLSVSLFDLGEVIVDESCNQNDGSVTLTVLGGIGPYSYAWDVSAVDAPSVTGLSGGDVNVTVTDTGYPYASGCSHSDTFTINTTPPPTGSIAGNTTICAGETYGIPVTLTGTGPFDVTVNGTVYTGLNDGDTIDVTPATTTTYTLTLTEDGNTPPCSYTTTSSVTVTVREVPEATLTAPTNVCDGDDATLEFATTPAGLTLDVVGSIPDLNGTLTDGDSFTVTPASPSATYTITEVAYTDAPICTNTTAEAVTVNVDPLPTATASFTGASTICAGDAVILHFDLTGTGPWTIEYTANGTAQAAINTAFNSYDLLINPGPTVDTQYCITQVTDGGTNCVNTASSCIDLTVNGLPTGTVTTTGPFCDGDDVNLTLNLTGNGPFNVSLTDPAGDPLTVTNPYNDGDLVTSPATSGDYCLTTVNDANGCEAAGLPNCTNITVDPLPSVDVSAAGAATICLGDNYDFTWTNLTGTGPFEITWSLLTADDMAVLATGTETGVINGDVLTLTPAESAILQIDELSDATAGTCANAAISETFTITVNPYTELALPADITLCQGEALDITLTFTNAVGPLLNVDLGIETLGLTLGDLDASGQYTYTSIYDTSVAGTGTLDAATLTDSGNACVSITDASTGIEVIAEPAATFTADVAICPGSNTDLSLDLPATGGPFDVLITNDAGDADITLTGENGLQLVNVAPSATTTYTLATITETGSGIGCSSSPNTDVVVTVNSLPTIVPPVETLCANTGDTFQVTFEITGGDPATYAVTTSDGYGGVISAGPPYIYTSDPMPDNTAQDFTVTDADGCAPETTTVDAFDCPVLTFSGTVDTETIFVCEDATFCVTQNGDEVLDADDVLSYAILDVCDLATATILSMQASNCWDLTTLAFPPFAYDTEYYVVALAGDDDGTGVTDLNDPNLSVSDCVPVFFVETPTATLSGGTTICSGAETPLQVDITGSGNFDLTFSTPTGVDSVYTELEAGDLPVLVDVTDAGDYTVTVINSYGCPGAAGSVATVDFFPLINATMTAGGEVCDGDAFTFEIDLQGDASWELELEFDNGTASGTTLESGIATSPYEWIVNQAGTYTLVSATDANGCTFEYNYAETLVVNDLPAAAWTETTINFCEGGSSDATIDLTGPADFTLNYSIDGVAQAAETATATPFTIAGINASATYTLDSVTDANGCTTAVDEDLVVTEVLLPTANAGADQEVCSDEAALLGTPAEGGNSYEWTVDSGVVEDFLNNTLAAEPSASITNTDSPTVYDYTFTVTVTEPVASCVNSDDVVVTVNPVPTANAGEDQQLCYGDAATLNGSGDGDCTWTDNGAFVDPADLLLCAPTTTGLLDDTTFELTITSAAGCTNTDEVTVSIPDALTETPDFDDVVCFEACTASLEITPAGGWGEYVVSGDFAALTASDLCAGTYNYTITDAQGCTVDGSITIDEQPAYYITDVVIDPPNCFGETNGEIEIQAAGAVEYVLDGTTSITNTFDDLGAGDYTVEVTDLNGCVADSIITIVTNSPEIFMDVAFTSTVVCFGEELEFSASPSGGVGDFTVNWYQDVPPPGVIYGQGNPLTVTMDEELLLYVVAYDENGCPSDTLNMEAEFSTPVSVSASPVAPQVICIGECVDVNAIPSGGSGPIEVTWVENGVFDDEVIGTSNTYTLCPDETVSYIAFADDGCAPVASDTVFVTVNLAPDSEFEVDVDFGCLPVEVTFTNLTPDPTTTCWWDFGDGNTLEVCEDVTYTYEVAGTYFPSLNVTSAEGCTGIDFALNPINVYGFPEADFYWEPVPVTTLENEVTFINISDGAVSYEWDVLGYGNFTTEDIQIEFDPVDLAVYEVCLQATNAFGCTDTLCQDVPMVSELLVYVPNAFTPDNDGLNDLFTPSVLGILPNTYVFKVFDRWGHVVFETREIGDGWNGSFQNGGYYVQEDVYIWQIEGQDVRNAEIQVFQGHVTVVR